MRTGPCLGCLGLAALLLAGCETLNTQSLLDAMSGKQGGLSLETIVAGLREALAVGTQNTVNLTGKEGGYALNQRLRIPVPAELETVAKTLRTLGFGSMVSDFEGKMNAAAEQAAAQAAPVFLGAIREMTFADAKAILSGPDTAATDYFRAKTSAQLRDLYAPIVRQAMEKVGAVTAYNNLLARYQQIPLVPKPKFTVESYVSEKGIDGLFTILADEERKIRQDPAARTTELLRRVFGS